MPANSNADVAVICFHFCHCQNVKTARQLLKATTNSLYGIAALYVSSSFSLFSIAKPLFICSMSFIVMMVVIAITAGVKNCIIVGVKILLAFKALIVVVNVKIVAAIKLAIMITPAKYPNIFHIFLLFLL